MLLNAVGIPRLKAGEEVNAQPKEKMYTLKDGGSLFLEVFPTGGKYWRFGFRFPKGDKTKRKLSLGAYPKVTLKTARESSAACGLAILPPTSRAAFFAASIPDGGEEDFVVVKIGAVLVLGSARK